jgi:hypothetical protein
MNPLQLQNTHQSVNAVYGNDRYFVDYTEHRYTVRTECKTAGGGYSNHLAFTGLIAPVMKDTHPRMSCFVVSLSFLIQLTL